MLYCMSAFCCLFLSGLAYVIVAVTVCVRVYGFASRFRSRHILSETPSSFCPWYTVQLQLFLYLECLPGHSSNSSANTV